MKRYLAVAVLLLFQVSLISGCIFDSDRERPRPSPPQPPAWPDLKEKDDVFEYLSKVYNNRNYDRYPKLLDDNFIFKFGVDDVGGEIPEQWGRTEELQSAQGMFMGRSVPPYGAVDRIDLTLNPEGEWLAIPQTDPPFDGETWYRKTVEYRLIVQTTGGWTLQGLNKKALFDIRYAKSQGDTATVWRIVRWSDAIK